MVRSSRRLRGILWLCIDHSNYICFTYQDKEGALSTPGGGVRINFCWSTYAVWVFIYNGICRWLQRLSLTRCEEARQRSQGTNYDLFLKIVLIKALERQILTPSVDPALLAYFPHPRLIDYYGFRRSAPDTPSFNLAELVMQLTVTEYSEIRHRWR